MNHRHTFTNIFFVVIRSRGVGMSGGLMATFCLSSRDSPSGGAALWRGPDREGRCGRDDVTYMGEFRLDEIAPWYTDVSHETGSDQTRNVIKFRMVPV